MSHAAFVLTSEAERTRVCGLAQRAPNGTRVTFKDAKRSLPMNDKLWAMLTDVSRQVVWHGQKLTAEDWKCVFSASLRKSHVVPGIDPGTVVVIGMSTSGMSKDEFSALLALIDAFGAEHGVVFHDREAA